METRRKSTRASSRTASVDSKKSKNEKEKDQAAASVDCDDASVSSDSLTDCKVVLNRISSASFNTRSRRKSTLTVDNVAAMDSPISKGKRSKASESVASDDTGLSRTRFTTRKSTIQNTPTKEAKSTSTRAGAATPTGRGSRLVESIDLTDSPVIPAKRALRSNSVASEDLPPASPSTRRSTRASRLVDTQGTPNRSKVDSESVMTPGKKGRASRLLTRQVAEIKEEEEEIETVPIIELADDSGQSSPKPKSKKRSTAKSETQAFHAETDPSSKTIETVPVGSMESEGNVLLVQTSTANLGHEDKSTEHIAQSDDSKTVNNANKSNDAITKTSKSTHDLNTVVGENATPNASIQSDQALPKEKPSVENKMTDNVQTDAIIVDESTLNHKKVDSIDVNSSDSGEPKISKPQPETSMESVLVIDEKANNTPIKGNDAIETSSVLKEKTPLRRPDLDFMFQSEANESPLTNKLASTPKPLKESNVSGMDQSMQVEKTPTPKKDLTKSKTPSKNDLSLMNVTELVNSPKPDTSAIERLSNQSKSPNTQTPSKSINEFADMDVTHLNNPSTSIIEKAAVDKEHNLERESQTPELDSILDSMNITKLVDSPKPEQDVQKIVAIEGQSPMLKTMTAKQNIQTGETTNALDLMNVTELVNSPKPKQRNEMAVIEKQSSKPKTPSKSATESIDTGVTDSSHVDISGAKAIEKETPKKTSSKQNTPKSTPVSDKIATSKNKTPKTKTPSKSATDSINTDVTDSSHINISGAKAIEKETPKKVSSKQNTPKSTPVSDKIATPKNKTPKAKTPSNDLNEFGDMNVTKLVVEVTVKTATPKKAGKNVTASVRDIKDTESVEMEGEKNEIAKSPSSNKKTTTPSKSPLSSALADQSINLNLEISKLYASLQSPNEKTETKTPDIFAIPIDGGKILDDTVEPMEVDQTQLGNMTSTSIDEQCDNPLDADDNNVSSVSVSSGKSVQIMTPKLVKNTSGLNRLGTPYPNKKEINAALARDEEIRKTADRFMGYVKDYQEKLKPLTESWNRSQLHVSTDKAGTSGVDELENKKDQLDEQPVKVAVPARNNWTVTKGLIDSDSETEPDSDIVSESENEDEQSEEGHSDLFDDKAEEIDDYESGDSEDEEDRRHREENELKQKGIDLGSDDTDDSENEDSDNNSLNSFIVDESDEDKEIQDSNSVDSIQNEQIVRGRRFSRIISEETSSDEEEQAISVSLGAVHQEVVIFGQDDQNDEENEIVEGKRFETMIFKKSEEVESVPKKQKKSGEMAQVSQAENESPTKSTKAKKSVEKDSEVVESEKEIIQQDELDEPAPSQMPKEINAEEVQPTTAQKEIENTTETTAVQKGDKVELNDSKLNQIETVHESNESDVSTTSLKENETAQINISKKINRVSLPGIEALTDSVCKVSKQIKRKSLGNLAPNQHVLTVAPARISHAESNLMKKQSPKASTPAEPKETVPEKSTIESDDVEANTSAKSIDSKVASTQKEKNKKKSVKGSKAKKPAKNSETLSTTQQFEEQDNVVDEAVPSSSKSTMSIDSADFKKSKKDKRQFVEIETKSEPSSPPRKPIKLLKIIESRSGRFIEEPITPEKKDRLGFKVTPMTPVNKAFRVEQLFPNGTNDQVHKSKKRKILQIEEPAIVLPKPHWTVEQDNIQPKKRARNISTGTTEIMVKSLNGKKRIKSARDLIPVELQRFRERNLYRAGIPRQDARSLLMDRVKRRAYEYEKY